MNTGIKNQPKAHITLDLYDRIIEIIGLLSLIVLFALPVYYYSVLPDEIPRHFNGLGEVNAYSSKKVIWILPFLGTLLYVGLFFMNKVPHIFNYPIKVTQENYKNLYKYATKQIRVLNTEVILIFLYITYTIIQIGLGIKIGMSLYFLPIVLVLIIATSVYYYFKMTKIK
ncbi:DUF1648 domain-containing protein [Flammeovirga kamogawensis]|uniref:DUF1648 domain-containing protein n=1 Tax=Flammeovirga kamogawensis TaxID=373891 RepID=A0ABX8H463_9BACT|nr:DUF1648 domain-containing protein [Flammeovirga kamogawensis]MBB6460137.1 putative membrane protein [Flammeovirga kamogawensis]QWG09950.1 DUF1648 domain-containing protein [Flammeovirga kamogawensis]TRX65458.1 DUF1648 domain-containing protein [Flammeovirga kamogawensis]